MLNRIFVAVLTAAFGVAGFTGESHAQQRYLEIAAQYGRAHVYHEAVVLPDGDSRVAVVSFRIPNSLLVFTQENDGFEADAELTAELYRDGKKVDEQIWRTRHRAASFESTQSRTADLQGFLRFDVEPGAYAYRIILNDDGADDRGAARTFHVPEKGTPLYGSLVFGTLSKDTTGIMIDAANLAGDVPFGVDVRAILPVASDASIDSDEPILTYQLYHLSPNRKEMPGRRVAPRRSGRGIPPAVAPDPVEIQPDDDLVTSGTVAATDLVPVGAFVDEDAGCLCWSEPDATAGPAAVVVIRLATHELESGTYVLDVTHRGDAESTKYLFSTHWRDMPLSLYDISVAIRNLEFIEDRDAIRAMLKGSRETQLEAFRAYWKQRDPTPSTVRNELMEEYYRRVDQAAKQFQTGQYPVPDGLRTDPARIYVLYGEPDDVTNTLPSSGGIEQTWLYADGRKFVFRAGSSLAPMELVE